MRPRKSKVMTQLENEELKMKNVELKLLFLAGNLIFNVEKLKDTQFE